MDQERPKRRKCGPRVKTGCITCRIRRVKCDEGKPNCQRCVSTGRKCDGYVPQQQKNNNHRSQLRPGDGALDVARRPIVTMSSPVELPDSQRNRQLFHFYCVQSAFDLSVYLNSGFWHDMILQYSHYHPVIRQAVVAFGSSHIYALSMNQKKDIRQASQNALEQVRQYDLAIRALREYMESEGQPDPHVILICCALFFSCENSRGNREAAWQHLENGLHILDSIEGQKTKRLLKNGTEVTGELELVASKNGSKLKAKTDKVEIDEELVYVFSRLDVQATLCKQTRKPVLNLSELSQLATNDHLTQATTFATITEAQRSLDYIHNRLARFLSAAAAGHAQDPMPLTPEPDWIDSEKTELNNMCANWESCMSSFVSNQSVAVKQNLQSRHAPKPSSGPNNPDWQLALQINLLILHHRCWWMLFRSFHSPSVWSQSPNPRAIEILDICEFLGSSLPLRPSAVYSMTETDIAWKMISEIGVTAPLFVLATKCADPMVRSRAIMQMTALRNHGDGMYQETFLDQVIKVATQSPELDDVSSSSTAATANSFTESALYQMRQSMITPGSDFDVSVEGSIHGNLLQHDDAYPHEQDSGGLLGWSKASSAI